MNTLGRQTCGRWSVSCRTRRILAPTLYSICNLHCLAPEIACTQTFGDDFRTFFVWKMSQLVDRRNKQQDCDVVQCTADPCYVRKYKITEETPEFFAGMPSIRLNIDKTESNTE